VASKKWWIGGLIAVVVLAIAGTETFLSAFKFRGSAIDPPVAAADFWLKDQTGQVFQLGGQRGKLVLLFFGYTSCPDVCPTTLAQFKRARAQLGGQAERVRFVFVTVDPERDTPAQMGKYLGAFDPAFVGLGGSEAELEPVWKAYGVYRQIQPGSSATGYLVDHSARAYLIDAQGNLRLTYAFGATADDMAADMRYLLKPR
jgi:protein SCO1/2